MYQEILESVKRIAKEASTFMKLDFKVKEKTSLTNVVTTADLNVQNYLYNNLMPLIPSAGFYAEEGDLDIHKDKDYLWIVDPIDGTMNFVRHLNTAVISIGLSYKDEIVLSVVYNPSTDEMYYAIKGEGSYLNGERLKVSDRSFEDSIVCIALSQYRKQYSPICKDIMYDIFMHTNDFRRFGSCALEICYLASGKCDAFFEIRVSPWDYSGAELILKEAGGYLTALNKERLPHDKDTPIIGANSKLNHEKMCDIINKYLKERPY